MSRCCGLHPTTRLPIKRLFKRVKDLRASDKKFVQIFAKGEWQNTGIQLVAGAPVHILAKGTWTISNEVGPAGIVIPEPAKLKDGRIKLGSLIGAISTSGNVADARPFRIGESADFTADTSGTLFLRMYDIDPTDNDGVMAVLVRSTFAQ